MPRSEDPRRMTRAILLMSSLALVVSATGAEPIQAPRPALSDGQPAAGKFVKQIAEEYRGTNVYHALYLPLNWQPGANYPVIVEFAPNLYPQGHVTGRVDDCRMGYWLSGGRDFIWVVMPFVNSLKKENQIQWWGDEDATALYCRTNLRRICEQFGGDPNAVIVTGFSRGAIACGYIGLRDEAIADIWLGFLPHSHIDGGRFTANGARERLARVRGRPTFITYGSDDNGKPESLKGAAILTELKFPIEQRELAGIGHEDGWLERDTPTRSDMRAWLQTVLKTRPGTHTLRGRVVDSAGNGIAGVRVQCGSWHGAFTNADGRYEIPSLVSGTRALSTTKTGFLITMQSVEIVIDQSDVTAPDIVAK